LRSLGVGLNDRVVEVERIEQVIHMVTASPARTPTMTMFGNDNYFFETGSGGACATQSDCVFVGPGFAWNHGDFQKDITRTWVAMVDPACDRSVATTRCSPIMPTCGRRSWPCSA